MKDSERGNIVCDLSHIGLTEKGDIYISFLSSPRKRGTNWRRYHLEHALNSDDWAAFCEFGLLAAFVFRFHCFGHTASSWTSED